MALRTKRDRKHLDVNVVQMSINLDEDYKDKCKEDDNDQYFK